MIGQLPKTLTIHGIEYPIRSDYRIALLIFQAINDPDLDDRAKTYILLDALYEDIESIEDKEEAMRQATWFLDGGKEYDQPGGPKLMDWEQDEQMVFSSINSVANTEVREKEYLHWWTFLGYFMEIKEGLFSTVLSIRQKKAKGKKLEKYEQEFYQKNKALIDIKPKYSAEELEEINRLNELLK